MGQNLIKSTNKRNTKSDVFLFCRSSFLKSAGLRFSKSASHASVETISVNKKQQVFGTDSDLKCIYKMVPNISSIVSDLHTIL